MAQATTLPTRFADQSASVLGAHTHLIERLQANAPHYLNPRYLADADDINERAEHLQRILIAVTDYVGAAVTDIADSSNCIDKKYIFGCLNDLTSEIVGTLNIAADEMQSAA